MKKWIYIGIGILVIGAGGYYGYQQYFKTETAMTIPAQTAAVTKGEMKVSVTGSGTVATANSKELKADESGEIGTLHVKEGGSVKKGQVLVSYTSPDVDNEIEQKQISIKKNNLQYVQLKKKYIEAEDDLARADVKIQIDSLKLDMQSDEAALADLKEQKNEKHEIVAPIAGKVTSVGVEEGRKVQENAIIAAIVDYENLQSVIQIDELDVTKVKVGQEAAITLDALPDTVIKGTVTKIADEGSASNGVSLFDVTIGFKAQAGVKVGMTASADILIASKQNVLMVPIEAIRERGSNKFVLVAVAANAENTSATAATGAVSVPSVNEQGSGTAPAQSETRQRGQGLPPSTMQNGTAQGTMRQVTVGIVNDTYIEVLSGLSEGERVILPTIVSSTSTNQTQGMPGVGGFGTGGFGGQGPGSSGFGGGGAGGIRNGAAGGSTRGAASGGGS